MKKIKKFEDGGPTGGRYVDMGDSQVFVPDTPVPIAAGLAGMQDGPRVEAQLAGLGTRMAGDSEVGYTDRPDVVARPMGLMVPPNAPRGIGSSIGTLGALRAAGMKKGGAVKKMAKGGSTSSASKRADGCAVKGKTKGRFV